jgi:hypothetical protein
MAGGDERLDEMRADEALGTGDRDQVRQDASEPAG